ncbi:hypothetical protein [Streptomyces sp. NBC_01207]|uniref:hypothetical protein n=1 Tax=Streptomyces sp. NBC_01207 TaxID=2903772 RepID=UPI002E1537E9|nr:hypothetical protein OG457_27210 [Streptomyces sp. NBC_01207]
MEANPEYLPDLERWHLADDAGTAWFMESMLTTWQLTGTPDGYPAGTYAYAWHFNTMQTLLHAVEAWDPATQDEPNGYVKRKGERREAPDRLTLPEYNRRRCHHGKYVEEGACPHIACEAWTPPF